MAGVTITLLLLLTLFCMLCMFLPIDILIDSQLLLLYVASWEERRFAVIEILDYINSWIQILAQ